MFSYLYFTFPERVSVTSIVVCLSNDLRGFIQPPNQPIYFRLKRHKPQVKKKLHSSVKVLVLRSLTTDNLKLWLALRLSIYMHMVIFMTLKSKASPWSVVTLVLVIHVSNNLQRRCCFRCIPESYPPNQRPSSGPSWPLSAVPLPWSIPPLRSAVRIPLPFYSSPLSPGSRPARFVHYWIGCHLFTTGNP